MYGTPICSVSANIFAATHQAVLFRSLLFYKTYPAKPISLASSLAVAGTRRLVKVGTAVHFKLTIRHCHRQVIQFDLIRGQSLGK